jgi:hypothetical protein
MKLEFLMEYHADLKPGITIGAGPAGSRRIVDVTGGTVEGPKLKGTILPSGGDWLTVGADGAVRLDVRATFHTEDGAYIYVQYQGILVPSEKSRAASASGGRTEYGDAYFMTAPRFETGDPRYAWLNTVVAVGEGRNAPNAVEYRVYQVVNG